MTPQKRKKDILRIITWGLIIWGLLSFIVFVFTGSLKSIYSIGIVVVIAVLRFIIPDYLLYRKEISNNRTSVDE